MLASTLILGSAACTPGVEYEPDSAIDDTPQSDLPLEDADSPSLARGNDTIAPARISDYPAGQTTIEPLTGTARSCPPGFEVFVGSVYPDTLVTQERDCAVGRNGADTIIDLSNGESALLGGRGGDTLRVRGPALAAGGGGRDRIDIVGPSVDAFGQRGPDTILADTSSSLINGGQGADQILVVGDENTVVPGPGADFALTLGNFNTTIVYSECELRSGKILAAFGLRNTLILPIRPEAAADAGVYVFGFQTVVYDPGLAHNSECHCFHGQWAQGACACEPAYDGQHCETCTDTTQCLDFEAMALATKDIMESAPPEWAENPNVHQRVLSFLVPLFAADAVVVAGRGEHDTFRRPTHSPEFLETFTAVDLVASKTLRGEEVSTVRVTFPGDVDGPPGQLPPDTPNLMSGLRLVAVRLLPDGKSHVFSPEANWRVTKDGDVDLGYFKVPLTKIEELLSAAKN